MEGDICKDICCNICSRKKNGNTLKFNDKVNGNYGMSMFWDSMN